MIQRDQKPSVRRQCELLSICRSSLYYEPEPMDEEQCELMRRIDQIHLDHPCYGSRMLTVQLRAEGHLVNRKRVQRLMRLMGLESMAPKPDTSRPAAEHPVFRTLCIDGPPSPRRAR